MRRKIALGRKIGVKYGATYGLLAAYKISKNIFPCFTSTDILTIRVFILISIIIIINLKAIK